MPRVDPPTDGQNARNSIRKARILMPRLELENPTFVKRSYPKPRVYPPMDGQNVRNSIGKARILVPRLELENSTFVKRSYPKPRGYPPNGWPKCEEFLRKSMDSGGQAGLGKFQARASWASFGLGFPSLGVAKM